MKPADTYQIMDKLARKVSIFVSNVQSIGNVRLLEARWLVLWAEAISGPIHAEICLVSARLSHHSAGRKL